MPKTLDLGCGNKKRPGSIGIDINSRTDADVIHDLDVFPYPFQDSTFDEIYVDNVIEHLEDVIKVMEELHRISKPNARINIYVPYFRAHWAFIDPTHKHFFTTGSFSYFDPAHLHNKLFPYSTVKFKTEEILLNERINKKTIFGAVSNFIKRVANLSPSRYERFFSHLYPLDELSFCLRVIK